MATFTVTTAADVVNAGDGRLSLREAVAQANATTAADTIVFAAATEGATLVLSGGELVVSRDVRIDGDQDNNGTEVTLSGGDAQRLLRTSGAGTDLALQDLTLADGRVEGDRDGGGVFVGTGSSLALTGCTVRDCESGSYGYDGSGGGIFAEGGSRLTVAGSSILGNSTTGDGGGGIAAHGNVALVVRNSELSGNSAYYAAGAIQLNGGTLVMEGSRRSGNVAGGEYANGGALELVDSTATIARSTISGNSANDGGGLFASGGRVSLSDSTIADNHVGSYTASGGGIAGSRLLVVRNSTITGNTIPYGYSSGGIDGVELDIANSIVAGNQGGGYAPDIASTITLSNGHNVFGSDVSGDIAGDRENVAPGALFATLDPDTGGGLLGPDGTVALRNDPANPALSGADSLLVQTVDQLGTARFLPGPTRADIGPVERNQTALSTAASPDNDVLTGNANANTLSALGGNDKLAGLGGNDTLDGGDGSDLFDGGPGNDRLNGDALNGDDGVDIAVYNTGTTAVVFDLSGATDTARRGSAETDTLTGIEGAIGSSAADTFRGDALANYFRGGAGKDTFTGGGGRDLYDYNLVADSPVGSATRDVVTDFAPGIDDLDLAGVDADTTVAGDQAFRFVGTAGLGTAPGAVGYYTSGGNTIVRASTDADSTAELEIQLTGLKTLTVDDFYL